MGIVKCKDFISLLSDSDGKMLTNTFEDNVRDFQGYNTVNKEIKETICNANDQNRFALLNNGITIIAKSIRVTGDTVELFDYQIVNGCQTMTLIFGDQRTSKSSNSMKFSSRADLIFISAPPQYESRTIIHQKAALIQAFPVF